MNILFLSLNNDTCTRTWPDKVYSVYNKLKIKHSITWLGQKQYEEVERLHQTNYGQNLLFDLTKYTQLLGKLVFDVINASCYDLVVCCDDIFKGSLMTNTPVICVNDGDLWTYDNINNILANARKKMNIYIPIYVINIKERVDRRNSIITEFEGKSEFELHLVDACIHRKGTVGLWNSIVQIVQVANNNQEDFVVICEDDHCFTKNYSPKLLIREIQEAALQRVEILSGGIGGFGYGFPTGFRRYWVDWFWCTQFMVIYASFFEKILSYKFKEDDTADGVISSLAMNKMVIYPFISEQKDFGYSDVTQSNNEYRGLIRDLFEKSNDKFRRIEKYNFKCL